MYEDEANVVRVESEREFMRKERHSEREIERQIEEEKTNVESSFSFYRYSRSYFFPPSIRYSIHFTPNSNRPVRTKQRDHGGKKSNNISGIMHKILTD